MGDFLEPTDVSAKPEVEAGMSMHELLQEEAVQSVPSGHGSVPEQLPSEGPTLANLQDVGGLTIADEQVQMLHSEADEQPDTKADEELVASADTGFDPTMGA